MNFAVLVRPAPFVAVAVSVCLPFFLLNPLMTQLVTPETASVAVHEILFFFGFFPFLYFFLIPWNTIAVGAVASRLSVTEA